MQEDLEKEGQTNEIDKKRRRKAVKERNEGKDCGEEKKRGPPSTLNTGP